MTNPSPTLQAKLEELFVLAIDELSTLDQKIIEIKEECELEKLKQPYQIAQGTIACIKKDFQKLIREFQQYTEWNTYTIAFYGETNAGKSTLIEALRIFFQEETKLEQQEKFTSILKEQEEKLSKNEAQVDEIKIKLNQVKPCFHLIPSNQVDKIKIKINQVANAQPFFLLRWLGALFPAYQKHLEAKKQEKLIFLKEQEEKLSKNEAQVDEIKKAYESKLYKLEDGKIIGDGRSDFTREITKYCFSHNNQNFTILDVPGIEGSEQKVIDEIKKATQEAHAVFYITRESTPPQELTLEKIKSHLGKQTEVHTIYNKSINNPIELDATNIVTENEQEALKELDKKMAEALGDHYIKCHTISAQVAFLSVAKNFIPSSKLGKQRKKFFEKFTQKEISTKSQLLDFTYFLSNEMVINTKEKIKNSNLNKTKEIFIECKNTLKKVSDEFKEAYDGANKTFKESKQEIESALNATKIEIDNICNRSIDRAISELSNTLYNKINSGIKDDQLESELESEGKKEVKVLSEKIKSSIDDELDELNKRISETMQRFDKKVNEKTKKLSNMDLNMGGIDLKIKGGDILGLTLSLAGVGVSGYFAFALVNSWNPLGWSMAAIGAALGLLASGIALGKKVWEWVNPDAKKSRQKEEINKALSELKRKLEDSSSKQMEDFYEQLEREVSKRKEAMKKSVYQFKTIQDLVDASRNKIEALEKNHLQ